MPYTYYTQLNEDTQPNEDPQPSAGAGSSVSIPWTVASFDTDIPEKDANPHLAKYDKYIRRHLSWPRLFGVGSAIGGAAASVDALGAADLWPLLTDDADMQLVVHYSAHLLVGGALLMLPFIYYYGCAFEAGGHQTRDHEPVDIEQHRTKNKK